MLEVEMKFPVTDPESLLPRLQALGARPHGTRVEIDQYFNAPDRDFAHTDEALRLRSVGDQNLLTYKGPKLDRQTKTRREIERQLEPGPDAAAVAAAFLISLGYRPTAAVRKRRQGQELIFQGFTVEICFDQVDDVGSYVELEIVAPAEQLDAARQAVQTLAQQLGLNASERRSYLELLLERHAAS